jgi:hypothetical protein
MANQGEEMDGVEADAANDVMHGSTEGPVVGAGATARARAPSAFGALSKAELNRGRMLYPEEEYWRPKTRTECVDMERPCPFVSCKYHLYIDVHPVRGSIKLNFPDVDVWEMTETCSLDIADRGGITLEEVGEIMNLTRERVRQVRDHRARQARGREGHRAPQGLRLLRMSLAIG